MKLTAWNFLSSQLTPTPEVPGEDLSGKTVIIVGANAGIGYETARHFAQMRPGKLILACRDQGRGNEAAERLARETGCRNIEMWLLDLGSFESVNAFAKRAESDELSRIDLLIENAGVLPTETLDGTQDGWETTFQVNNLSTSLLALLLVPRMIKTAQEFNTKPRIVVVSSEVHYFAKLHDKVLKSDEPLRMFGKLENCEESDIVNRYYDTKLFNVFFVRSLAERLKDQPLIVDTVNPGYCLSNLRKGLRGFRAAVDWMMEKLVARTSEEGARQVVWAAIGRKESEEELRGAYVSQMGIREPSDFVVSAEGRMFQEKIWVEMIEELCVANPNLQAILNEYLSAGDGETRATKITDPLVNRKTSTTSPALDNAMRAGDGSEMSIGEAVDGSNDKKQEVREEPTSKFSYAAAVSNSRGDQAEDTSKDSDAHGQESPETSIKDIDEDQGEAADIV